MSHVPLFTSRTITKDEIGSVYILSDILPLPKYEYTRIEIAKRIDKSQIEGYEIYRSTT